MPAVVAVAVAVVTATVVAVVIAAVVAVVAVSVAIVSTATVAARLGGDDGREDRYGKEADTHQAHHSNKHHR
ncbi:hypothetical protein [Rhodococcus erythropolis]|uniref:hypothetical protein n=1 Tax=Rhodococcus erythropolis TaxID=1833 RepID=UPI003D117DE9